MRGRAERARAAIMAAGLLLLVPPGAGAQDGELTAAEVVERYVEARGGREAWGAIETLKISGTFTSFSREEPFTALFQRGGGYRFDTRIQGDQAYWGVDDEGAWWMRPMQQMSAARRPARRDAIRIVREGRLDPLLFDAGPDEEFPRVELLGRGEVDGIDVVSLRVTLDSGLVETWHLDPDTHLEVAIDSRVHDYTQTGDEIDQRAYFSDFRKVGDVLIPHLEEREYKSRHTIHRIESVEIDPPLAADAFRMPVAPAMVPLQALAGEWAVTVEGRRGPQAPWETSELRSRIASLAGGSLLEERFEQIALDGAPMTVVRTFSHDPFAGVYRLTTFDTSTGQLRVFDGTRDDEGIFLLSNAETGTRIRRGPREFYERFRLLGITDEGFRLERELSLDSGESWIGIEKFTYQK